MNLFSETVAILFVLGFSCATANSVNIDCEFQGPSCVLDRIIVANDQNLNFIIGGNHLPNQTNIDITNIEIRNSFVPFIITQLFTTFPVFRISLTNDMGLSRIQTGAFVNAQAVLVIDIRMNSQLRQIHANAFTGAANAWILFLDGNRIDSIHESAFDGLSMLRTLQLQNNQIRHLPANLLGTLRELRNFLVSNNQLQFIDGSPFHNNRILESIDFSRNQIIAVSRDIFHGRNFWPSFDFTGNKCADFTWRWAFPINEKILFENLRPCFENADKMVDVREIRA